MKQFEYTSYLTFTTETRSKKEADKCFKPILNNLKSFCSSFGIRIDISDSFAHTDLPGVYRYSYTVGLSVLVPPRYVVALANAIRLFSDLNRLEMSDEYYQSFEDEE